MLGTIRNVSNTWIMKILFGILLLSFALGGGMMMTGGISFGGSNALFTSGKSSLSPAPGQDINNPQVLQQLQFQVLLAEEARLMNIGLSRNGIADFLRQDPSFQDESGKYNAAALRELIANSGLSQEAFFNLVKKQAQQDLVIQALTSDMQAPQTLVDALSLYRDETRNLDYITITPASPATIAGPDEAALAAWFEKNSSRFTVPEYREVTLMPMLPTDTTVKVSDEEIKAFYEEHREDYSLFPFETVQDEIRQQLEKAPQGISSVIEANQRAIEKGRFNNKSLNELAPQYNLAIRKVVVDTDGKTPGGEAADLPQAAGLLPAIFNSLAGVDADPVQDNGGYIWFHVEKVLPARAHTLDEVRAQATEEWKEQEALRLLDEKAAAMKQALDAGTPIKQIATDNKLPLASVETLTRSSQNDKIGKQALQLAFSGPAGTTGLARNDDGKSYTLVQVTNVALPAKQDAAVSKQVQAYISYILPQDLTLAYIGMAEKQHPIQVNQALLQYYAAQSR
ncbi:MAG: Prolyl isomerase [Candidatus Tokpelaia hoelldobleri]|uniref:Prolyl isomerase n=1 Tax=Candidatus Tokpelaia hoelldobleri TaxID=1902579 RepID=A0A1U9JU18_9HYPH|nr:MAG: Prolyl isomerase [Candidatus Tokpelaia hoelldoblerii]